jgi:heme-degrading monooxygenase HmoA
MFHQLRIYEIFENNKAAFHDRFRDQAMRIMKAYGFDFVAMWESRTGNRTEFVYLLAWPDENTMLDAWQKFRADEEWKEIKRVTNAKHGDLVGEIKEKVIVPTAYSPRLSGAKRSKTAQKSKAERRE